MLKKVLNCEIFDKLLWWEHKETSKFLYWHCCTSKITGKNDDVNSNSPVQSPKQIHELMPTVS